VCIPTDILEPYNFFLLGTHAADARRGTPSRKAASFEPHITGTPDFGHHPKWGETPEELRASINFETPDDEDAYGNKLKAGDNLTPVFDNNYGKVYAAINNKTGEFQECASMGACEIHAHWTLKLTNVKMDAMVFERKTSLIAYTNGIKESKAASDRGVSCQPIFASSVKPLTFQSAYISHYFS